MCLTELRKVGHEAPVRVAQSTGRESICQYDTLGELCRKLTIALTSLMASWPSGSLCAKLHVTNTSSEYCHQIRTAHVPEIGKFARLQVLGEEKVASCNVPMDPTLGMDVAHRGCGLTSPPELSPGCR